MRSGVRAARRGRGLPQRNRSLTVVPGFWSTSRKRSIVVDTLGLLLAVMVTAANVSDNEAGRALLTRIAADCPTITKAWVDSGCKVKAVEHGAALGIDVDVVPSPGKAEASR